MAKHEKRIREEHSFWVGEKPNELSVGVVLEDGKRPVLLLPDAVVVTADGRQLYLDRGYDGALIEALHLAGLEMDRWSAEHEKTTEEQD